MPSIYKHGVVIPLLKKPSLDVNVLSNFRPVTNLPFISKLIERIVSIRITAHLEKHNLMDIHQSAYRQRHSCETALNSIFNDVFLAMDRGDVTLVLLLDMSTAFDCVDHSILLSKLSKLGIAGGALLWIEGYLSERSQSVKIADSFSPPRLLKYGVPHGSVLGSLLFSLYMIGIDSLFAAHNVRYKLYADDIQVYISTSVTSVSESLATLERCVKELKVWLANIYLHLNEQKTEAIILGTTAAVRRCGSQSIRVGESDICFRSSVRNLGVIIDSGLTMNEQVSKICRSSFAQLRLIGRLNRVLNFKTRLSSVQALVFPHLNYCASLLVGVSKKRLKRLQRIINASARFVLKNRNIDSFIKDRGWLSIDQLVKLRFLCLVHSVMTTGQPSYLRDLLKETVGQRSTRSSSQSLLLIPRCRLKVGGRSFSILAARMWNAVPLNIRNLKSSSSFREKVEYLVKSDSLDDV